MKMQFGIVFKFFVINGISFSLALNPLHLFDSGLKVLLDFNSFKSNSSQINDRETVNKKNVNLLYGKPIADKSSVIDSLFEINAKEIIDNRSESTNPFENQESPPPINSHLTDNEEKVNNVNSNSVWSIFQDVDFLPLVNKYQTPNENKIILDKKTLNYLDSVREDVWKHFKTLLVSYIDKIDSDSSDGYEMKNSLPVKMLLKILDFGDKANIIHLLGKKIDPNVASFLIKKFKDYLPDFVNLKHLSENDVSAIIPPLRKMINKFSWMSLRHIIDKLIIKVNNTYTEGELDDYIKSLEKTNEVAAKGLKFVLNLPSNIPVYDEAGMGRSLDQGRNFRGIKKLRKSDYNDGYHDDRDIGYDDLGSHSGGSHGGYHQIGGTIDPYLILAGIGTAALLAFVALRILNTTTSSSRRRQNEALGFSGNSESPSPDEISLFRRERSVDQFDELSERVINSIEDGHLRFEDIIEEAEDMIETMNFVWKSKHSDICSKCRRLSKTFSKREPIMKNLKTVIL